jgi:hypothetical protein
VASVQANQSPCTRPSDGLKTAERSILQTRFMCGRHHTLAAVVTAPQKGHRYSSKHRIDTRTRFDLDDTS